MAKIISGTQVGARGKAAGMVYQKGRNGETIQRRYVIPANPRTNSQMAQRILFATASQAAKFMSPVVDHSFEGVKAGLSSVNMFVKKNIAVLRSLAASDYAKKPAPTECKMFCTTKGVSALVPNAYMISNGSLAKPRLQVVDGGDKQLVLKLGTLPATATQKVTITNVDYYGVTLGTLLQAFFGLGDATEQLTLCAIARSSEEMLFSLDGSTDPGYEIPYTAFNARRLVFREDADLSQIVILLNSDGTAHEDINENIATACLGAFSSADSDQVFLDMILVALQDAHTTPAGSTGEYTISIEPETVDLDEYYIYDIDTQEGHVYAGGVIRSKKVGENWRYSRSFMTLMPIVDDHNCGLIWALSNAAWFRTETLAESDKFLQEGGSKNEVGENF